MKVKEEVNPNISVIFYYNKGSEDLLNEAKILCAERQGILGVSGLNDTISKIVLKGRNSDNDGYFIGQPLIITQNQQLFRLYNGDTGIVVSFILFNYSMY